jgi:dTDP-4-amino-4,6-dideoxygalactose transaminase
VTAAPPITIPFNRPACLGRELEYVAEAFRSGHISGDGAFTRRATELLERELGAKVLLTTSCTHALEMAALLLKIEQGDEVIVPAFTFPSTINAFVLRGASPVFVDIRPDTLNVDEREVERHVTARTKALVPVHYAGIACEMDRLVTIAEHHGLSLIEDNAHGLFGRYNGRYLGSFGRLSTLSFHETKNFTCGEGGALVINDPALSDRAEILREKGTDRSRFFRGEIDKYGWVDIGSSYLPSDVLGAILFAQLEKRYEVQARRQCLWMAYSDGLRQWAASNGVQLPPSPRASSDAREIEPAYHLFYLLMPSGQSRDALIAHLRQRGILAVFHYLPLNRSVMARQLGAAAFTCPVAEDVSARLVRLPFFTTLSDGELAAVIEGVRTFEVGD